MSDVYAHLTDVIDALTQPTQERTPMHTWSKDRRNRNKIRLPDHVTIVPGLLTQLAAQAFPLTAAGEGGASARQVPQSKEPGNPLALASYLDIHTAVIRWTARFELPRRDTLASTVRQLLGSVPFHPRTVQIELLSAANGWLDACQRGLGLVDPDPVLTVPCPVCWNRTLRVDLEEHSVRCTACGDRWVRVPGDDAGDLAVLAKYVTRYRSQASGAADAARAEVRRRKAAATYRPTA